MGDQERATVWTWLVAAISRRARLVIALVLVALVAVIGISRWHLGPAAKDGRAEVPEEAARPASPDVVAIDRETQRQIGLTVVTAQTAALQQRIRVTGIVGPNEVRLAHIRPPGRGVIQKVFVRLGDRGGRGQPLVQYDNIELGEAMAEYRITHAALQSAQAAADVATRALERARTLTELGAMAQSEYERRRAEEAAARAAVNSQEAAVASVGRKLQRFGVDPANLSRTPDPALSGP